ncbi:receptor-like protein kinase [Hirschfeldia incana]|nr:receptor-like protein kinase [Hirschfeldia incana]
MTKQRKKSTELVLLIIFAYAIGYGEAQSKSFLVDCGSNTSTKADGRIWVGDLSPNNSLSLSSSGLDATSPTPLKSSAFSEIYKSARVFTTTLNYSFHEIPQGSYFVRLHFSPFPMGDTHNVNDSSFSVYANGLRLMLDINIQGEIAHKNLVLLSSGHNATASSLLKEFILPVGPEKLVLSFIPEKESFGFVNAIEVVSVDYKLFKDSVTKVGGSEVELGLGERGVETMYRLNVGGPKLGPSQDLNLYRTWETDSSYMVIENAGEHVDNTSSIANESSPPVAPLLVYETARTMSSDTEVLEKRFNMSWKFEVDPNFDYLVRLHFCELVADKQNLRIFRIYINNQTAAGNFDIYARAGGKNKAIYQDYFDPVSSKNDILWIQLGPDTSAGTSGLGALLSGVEIFKLSKNGNLAHLVRFDSSGHSVDNSRMRIIWISVGAVVATIILLAFLVAMVVCLCKMRRNKSDDDSKNNPPGWRPLFLHVNNSTTNAKAAGGGGSLRLNTLAASAMGRKFTLAEIRAATKNFDDGLAIGVGGFGKVYRGELEDGTVIAIKRATPHSQQGLAEFETEIVMLSRLRHRHLVSLIGFCDEHNEMILVYEYMANGTLRSHLFGSNLPPLSWKQRLEACIGSARGLHYLHTGSERGIIHRDVKTTNILLDENFVAKMSDFGLSKAGPSMEHTHVSTAVKGSFGYLDPEYFRRQQLTEKSDVYSFGVVLFEAVCARAVINPTLPKDQINLAEWALSWQKQRSLETIIDPNLRGSYSPESLEKYGEIAEKCLADEGKNRPMMGEVLWHLEYVLQLHEAWLRKQNGENSFSSSQALEEAPESSLQACCSNQDSSEAEKSQTGSTLHNNMV